MQYKNIGVNYFAKTFIKITATMKPVVMAYFSETTCYGIFEYWLAASFKDEGLFGSIFTYFSTV